MNTNTTPTRKFDEYDMRDAHIENTIRDYVLTRHRHMNVQKHATRITYCLLMHFNDVACHVFIEYENQYNSHDAELYEIDDVDANDLSIRNMHCEYYSFVRHDFHSLYLNA